MIINEMQEVTEEIWAAFQKLIPQLTQYSSPPTWEALRELASSSSSTVFLARSDGPEGEIIGAACLGTFQTLTGVHGWIEDVIVDGVYRQQGIGKALTQACLDKARAIGLQEVNLTSNPTRKAANTLYRVMGFIQRETNVYRYPIDG